MEKHISKHRVRWTSEDTAKLVFMHACLEGINGRNIYPVVSKLLGRSSKACADRMFRFVSKNIENLDQINEQIKTLHSAFWSIDTIEGVEKIASYNFSSEHLAAGININNGVAHTSKKVLPKGGGGLYLVKHTLDGNETTRFVSANNISQVEDACVDMYNTTCGKGTFEVFRLNELSLSFYVLAEIKE